MSDYNETVEETEQWKLTGDCDKCRRQPFCRKQCTAKKVAAAYQREIFKQQIMDAILPPNFPRDPRW